MDALTNLIGKQVVARIPDEEKPNGFNYLIGKVINVDVNDFHFYEKNEPIYITITLQPKNEDKTKLNDEELEVYNDILLEYITLH